MQFQSASLPAKVKSVMAGPKAAYLCSLCWPGRKQPTYASPVTEFPPSSLQTFAMKASKVKVFLCPAKRS